jgi:hypothetical protein
MNDFSIDIDYCALTASFGVNQNPNDDENYEDQFFDAPLCQSSHVKCYLKNEKGKKDAHKKTKKTKSKNKNNKNEDPESNANDEERSESETPETANEEGTQSPKANLGFLKISKLLGAGILVGCSIGFLV